MVQDIRQVTTSYVHPTDPNLLNIHKALVYRDDEPHLRVTLGSDNITITGDVNLVDNVRVNNSLTNPVPVFLTNPLTTSTVYQGTNPWVTTVTNWPALQLINGIVYAVQSGTWSVGVTGNVTVDNFTSTVNIASMPAVTGTVAISSLPDVTGTVTVNGSVTVTNFTSTVNVASLPAITGTVAISSLPEVEIKNDTGNPIPISATTAANSLSNPISIQITKNGLAVSDTVALPTRVLNDEALIAYARGKAVTEADVLNAYLIDKSGATAQMGVTPETMTTVWGGTGLYPWNTFTGTGAKIYIKSVTNDAKIQGKSVTIEGLDSNYDILIETVTLHATDTTTPVSTVNNFYRTNKMYLSGANTNSLPHDYNIELRYGSSSGTLVGQMNAPWGRGQNCFYTVPRGYEGFVLSINGNSGKADEITSSLWFHPYGGSWTLQKSFKFISGMFDHNFRTPLRITEKSDVEIRAYALVESSRIGTEFQMLVLPKA
jgi:hypothetical protein